MSMPIPSASDVQAGLAALSHAQIQELSRRSGVPFTTIWKVRDGTTKNPGIKTVGKFMAYLGEVQAGQHSPAAEAAA